MGERRGIGEEGMPPNWVAEEEVVVDEEARQDFMKKFAEWTRNVGKTKPKESK